MNDQKAWYLSKGVWSGIIAAGAGVAGLFGWTIPEGEVQNITEYVVSGIVTVAGLAGVYGRIKATKKLTVIGTGKGLG
jgi:hypothetical protein